ncbi:MAG: phosphatase PAP2 family protein [Myxococcota bacterium]
MTLGSTEDALGKLVWMQRFGMAGLQLVCQTARVRLCVLFGGPRPVRVSVCIAVFCVGFLASPSGARGQAPSGSPSLDEDPSPDVTPRLEWGDRPRFSVAESISTGLVTTGLLVFHFGDVGRDGAPWTGRISFDEGIRNGLRANSSRGQHVADRVADALMYTLQLYPFVIDTGLTALAIHRSPEVAAQMFLINTQAFAITTLFTVAVKGLALRERPYGRNCTDGSDQTGCDSDGRYASFFSGHTATSFTGAGLICAHHTNLDLYGSEAAGRAACGSAVGAAAVVGAMRMVGDKHYMSDVLLGATVGLLSGYVMPKLIHYRGNSDDGDSSAHERRVQGSLTPMAGPGTVGLSYQGIF